MEAGLGIQVSVALNGLFFAAAVRETLSFSGPGSIETPNNSGTVPLTVAASRDSIRRSTLLLAHPALQSGHSYALPSAPPGCRLPRGNAVTGRGCYRTRRARYRYVRAHLGQVHDAQDR